MQQEYKRWGCLGEAEGLFGIRSGISGPSGSRQDVPGCDPPDERSGTFSFCYLDVLNPHADICLEPFESPFKDVELPANESIVRHRGGRFWEIWKGRVRNSLVYNSILHLPIRLTLFRRKVSRSISYEM